MRRKYFFTFSLMISLCFSYSFAQNIQHANDTIEDKSIVVPEGMTEDLSHLLHDWQIDFSSSKEKCKQGPDIIYQDSVYMNKLHAIPSEMELSYNRVVRSYIDMYSGRKRAQVAYMLALGEYYFPMFEQILDKYKLPLELKYLPIIESALNPIAVSRAGATGLWQFMMRSGKGYGLEVNSLVDERRDPYKSTEAAVRYLKDLYSIYNDWNLVIAAYNCGPGNVNKAITRSGGKRDYWEIYYYLPRETRGYVPAFIAANYIMNYYGDHNICPMQLSNFVALDTIQVNKTIHMEQISDVLNISLTEIRRLNPQFKRDIVPGNFRPYTLVLPTNKVTAFIDKKDEILNYHRSEYITHRLTTDKYLKDDALLANQTSKNVYYKVRKGDNLKKIAKKYGTTVAKLKSWNRLKSGKLSLGKRLIVKKKRLQVKNISTENNYAQLNNSSSKTEKTINQYYRVKRGDTLNKIARKNHISVTQLQSWNGLKSHKLTVGKQLIVSRKKEKKEEKVIAHADQTSDYAEKSSSKSNIISNYLKKQKTTSDNGSEDKLSQEEADL